MDGLKEKNMAKFSKHSYGSQDPKYLEFIQTKLTEKIDDPELFLKLNCESGDELYKYNCVEKLCGSLGLAILRNKKVIRQIVIGVS